MSKILFHLSALNVEREVKKVKRENNIFHGEFLTFQEPIASIVHPLTVFITIKHFFLVYIYIYIYFRLIIYITTKIKVSKSVSESKI